MNVHLRRLAAEQRDIVAGWQLLAAGWSRWMVAQRVRKNGWRVVHPGVYALTQAPLTREQRWFAAALTAPDGFLSHASAGARWAFRPWEGTFETITRPGSGGPKRLGGVLVCRSRTLAGNTTTLQGLPITTPERTLIDLAAQLDARETGRMFREAVRLKVTTAKRVRADLSRSRGRPGTSSLTALTRRYATLPYARTRSNAEARALELLHDAGIEPPQVNARIAGQEADLTWPSRKLIVAIDGPQYHRFKDEDARKQAAWEAVGYVVRRVPSDAVYDAPDLLIAAAA